MCSSDLKQNNFGYCQNLNPTSRTKVVHYSIIYMMFLSHKDFKKVAADSVCAVDSMLPNPEPDTLYVCN